MEERLAYGNTGKHIFGRASHFDYAAKANSSKANEYHLTWLLRPSPLPSLDGEKIIPYPPPEKIEVPPQSSKQFFFRFDSYACVYTNMEVSGGPLATVSLEWVEVLADAKGQKDRTLLGETSFFGGIGDIFVSNGGHSQKYYPFFWHCGRIMRLYIVNPSDKPFTIDHLEFIETHYPIHNESSFQCDDPRVEELIPLLFRTLEMCTHDTFMDCPYYERLMYIGDARIEALVLMCMMHNADMVKRTLAMFARSRADIGFTLSRYPTRARQVIPPYSLLFINMVHEFAMWRGERDFLKTLLPRIREILEAFLPFITKSGVLRNPPGWNFIDWAREWSCGEAPTGKSGENCILSRQYELALGSAAALENYAGYPEYGSLYQRRAREMGEAIHRSFYDEKRGLYADDLPHRHYSEHAQILALIAGHLPSGVFNRLKAGLETESGLARATVYFSHYLFEAAQVSLSEKLFYSRLGDWFDLCQQGFATVPECPAPNRSDCHAWGVHPYYHFFTTALGIRPVAPEFAKVEIAPLLGPWKHIAGKLPHPAGFVRVDLKIVSHQLDIKIQLPPGVGGVFRYNGQESELTTDGKKTRLRITV